MPKRILAHARPSSNTIGKPEQAFDCSPDPRVLRALRHAVDDVKYALKMKCSPLSNTLKNAEITFRSVHESNKNVLSRILRHPAIAITHALKGAQYKPSSWRIVALAI